MVRHWYTTIRSQLFRSVKIHDQITATWFINSLRKWWSSKIWRLDRETKGDVCWYFAMDSQCLGEFSGKGGGKKKGFQYFLNPCSSNQFLYFRAIQGHSGEDVVEFIIARQYIVIGWLRRVHLPHRERLRDASHFSKWIDNGRTKQQEEQTVSVLHNCETDWHSTWSKRSWIRSG